MSANSVSKEQACNLELGLKFRAPCTRKALKGIEGLVHETKKALKRAYAPYSGIKVGASVLTRGGRIYSGCNVENASYGLTVCAERVAVLKAISESSRDITAVAVGSNSEQPLLPCGACLQVISEFATHERIPIVVVDASGRPSRFTLRDLLPSGTNVRKAVRRTQSR